MKAIKLFTFGVMFFFIFLSQNIFGNQGGLLGDLFRDLEVSIRGTENFVIQKNRLREGLENSFWTITAKNKERILKIEVIKNIDIGYAQQHIKEQTYILQSLYSRLPSAYPGMISNEIECAERFRPKTVEIELEKKKATVWLLQSTSRLTYGACSEDLIKYHVAMTFIYNERAKILYRFDFFTPKDLYKEQEVLKIFESIKMYRNEKPTKINRIDVKKEKTFEQKKEGGLKNSGEYNLIIIGFDPLGAKHMTSYGYFRDTTPNLNQFAQEAVLFKNAISPSSWTLPVFMSWFTSLYPSQHKIVNKYSKFSKEEQILSNLTALSPSVMTLAQVMKENGYATAGFTGDAGVNSIFGYDLGFDEYYDETKFGGFDVVLPKALKWLKKHKEEKFFLFIQAYDVHGRAKLPKHFKNRFKDAQYKGKYKGTIDEYWALRNLSLDKNDIEMSEEDVKFWESWYDAKIYEADKRIGGFFKELEKLDIPEHTVILISSASGNEFYEHKQFDHGYSLYDELIKVPLMIKVPRGKRGVIKDQVRTVDIMPTVLDLLNITKSEVISQQMQGVSLRPLIEGKDLELDAFSETDYLLHSFKRSIRTAEGWKFIYSLDTGERELYDLNNDSQELNNLSEVEQKISYELEQRLFDWMRSAGQDKKQHKKLMKDVLQ